MSTKRIAPFFTRKEPEYLLDGDEIVEFDELEPGHTYQVREFKKKP